MLQLGTIVLDTLFPRKICILQIDILAGRHSITPHLHIYTSFTTYFGCSPLGTRSQNGLMRRARSRRQSEDSKANIIAVSVSPGISRVDTVAPFYSMRLDILRISIIGVMLYLLSFPTLMVSCYELLLTKIYAFTTALTYFCKVRQRLPYNLYSMALSSYPVQVLSQSNPGANDGKPKGEAKEV